MTQHTGKIFANISLALTAAVWGGGFIAVKILTDFGLSPEMILALRFVVSALGACLIFHKHLRFSKTELLYGSAVGVIMFAGFYAQTMGIKTTTPSNNAFLTAVGVIIVPFLEWAALKRKPRLRIFMCAAMAVTGVAVLTWKGSGISLNSGDMLTLLCSFLFAVHTVSISYAHQKVSTEKLLLLQLLTSAVLSVLSALIFDRPGLGSVLNFGLNPWLAALYLGLFSSLLAFFFQTAAQKHSSAAAVSVILSTEALFGTVFSVILGYDMFTVNLVIGGAVIVLSVIFMDLDLSKFTKTKRRVS